MAVYLTAAGFISILGQVIILRELNAAFYGIELIYILSIGLWLIGTSAGASLGKLSSLPKEKSIQILFFFSALMLIADIVFIRSIRLLFKGVPGGYLPFFTQLLAMAIALIPLSMLMGFLFQWTAKRFISEKGTLAKAYSIESLGGITGGLASTLFMYAGLQNFSIAIICSIGSLGLITYFSIKKSFNVPDYIFSLTLLLFILLLFASPFIDRWMTRWDYPYLIESIDTPYNRLTITSMENQVSVFEDGALSYETEGNSAEEFIQLSTLHADRLDDVLVLGGGSGGIISELLKLPVNKVDYVEINKDLITVLENFLPARAAAPLKDKRVSIIYSDPREFLKKEYFYDALIVSMPEPSSAQSNRFYTAEFFRQCSERMKPEAILAFKVHSAENIWTSQLTARNKSIYNALSSAFKNIVVLPGAENIFIASKSHLSSDPMFLTSRFKERKPETKLVNAEYINYIYTNDRFSGIGQMLSNEGNANEGEFNSDIKPACYSYTLSIWLSKFFISGNNGTDGYLSQLKNIFSSAVFLPAMIVLLIIIITYRRLSGLRRFILVALAGFTGMILETILILNYQSRSGVLYRDIGILLMAFMAGLTLGSYFVNKVLTSSDFRVKKRSAFGILLLLGFTILNLSVYFAIQFNLADSIVMTSAALAADGFFVAAVFSFASLSAPARPQAKMLPLYSADLIGGCLGSVAASLILIPFYGMLLTSLYLAAAALLLTVFVI